MKKLLLLTIALVSATFLCQAQINKGSVLLGGGISAGRSKSESNSVESTYRSLGFSPTIGVAVKENAVVGLRLSYNRSKSEQRDPFYLQESTGYSAGLFYRKYLGLSKAFYLFGEGAAYYAYSEHSNESIYSSTKQQQSSRSVGVNLYPGVAYVVSRRFHLEVGLNNLVSLEYSSNRTDNISPTQTNTTKSSGIGFSTNLSTAAPLTVGFRFVLGK